MNLNDDFCSDGGLSGPGTADEKAAAADRDFYETPGALDAKKNIIDFDRQVTREDFEDLEAAEVIDLMYDPDDPGLPRLDVGLIAMDQQFGRESLDGDEAELLCNLYVDEDYEPDLGPTRPSLRGFRMGLKAGRIPRAASGAGVELKGDNRTTVERALKPGETGLVFAPTSQSANLGAGSYTPNELQQGEFRGLSQRASAPVLSFTKARVGDRLKKIEKTGPMPRVSFEDSPERSMATSLQELGPIVPRSILKVRGSVEERATQSLDGSVDPSGEEEPGMRRTLQVEFVGLAQSMPAELAAGVMDEMQRTRAMTARLKQRMAERIGTIELEPSPEPEQPPKLPAVKKTKETKKSVRFADQPSGPAVTRLHLSAPHKVSRKKKGRGKESSSGRRIENVEVFEQDPSERDRSFVAGPHIGHGRKELRRRLEQEKAEADAATAAAAAASREAPLRVASAVANALAGVRVASAAAGSGEEPAAAEPEPEPEPALPAEEEDLGPDDGGYE